MTAYDDWRADQHEDTATPADIAMTAWLATVTADQLNHEQARTLTRIRLRQADAMTPAEIALIRRRTA